MILTHDLGEAIVGDKTPANKTPEHKQKEKNAIEAIGMLGSYFGNKLFTIAKDYKDFESKNEENINIKIANELDKLDNLMQLYVYALKQKLRIPDYESWRRKQIESITSEPGRKIRDMIIDYYEHYL
jgi:5'-deoxynucleotidase YfbR-like HD superfamily hydrolase